MKRAAAIVLSLMFLWLQAVPSAPTTFRPAPTGCQCCDCKTDCCVSAATPAAQPPAALPSATGFSNDFSLFAPALVMWTLPVAASSQNSFSDSAPLSAPAVPLFTRHCARLI